MSASPDAPQPQPQPPQDSSIGQAITEISERASLLVREEIELAKAEVSQKLAKLARGAVVGMAAGMFVVVGLLFLLHSAAWGVYTIFGGTAYWAGFLIVAGALFLLGAIAGMLAYRVVRKGAPPTPVMAIDEARKIRETVTGSEEAS